MFQLLRTKIIVSTLLVASSFINIHQAHAQVADYQLQMCVDEHMQDNNWLNNSEVLFLECSGRAIANLDGIESFPNLQSLDVSRNILSQLYALTNATLVNLESLDVSENPQLLIDDVIPVLDYQSTIKNLRVRGFHIEDLGIFPPHLTPQFELLDISNNNLRDFYNLQNFTNLLTLIARDNRIEFAPEVGDLVQLERLDLRGNRLSDLVNFQSLTNLRFLDLSYNPITDVYEIENIVSQNANLQGLGIAGLQELPYLEFAVQNPSLLTWLDISEHNIDNGQWLYAFSNLESLFANSVVGDIQGVLANFSSLTTLELADSGILNALELSNLINLRDLDLQGTLVEDTFALRQLILDPSVNLDRLRLSKLNDYELTPHDVCQSNPQLKELAWTDSGLTDIYGLDQCAALEILNLSGNNLQEFDAGLFSSLTHIDVSKNNISQFYSFGAVSLGLHALNIGYNPIQNIYDVSNTIANSPMIQSLGLAGITDYWSVLNSVSNPKNLTWLDLSETDGYFDYAVFDQIEHLFLNSVRQIDFYGLSAFVDLKTLNMIGADVTDLMLIQNLEGIEVLDISGAGIYDDYPGSIYDFIVNPARSFKVLKLSGVRLDGDLYQYCNAHPNLRELDVSDTGLFSLIGFDRCQNLRSLSAAKNLIDDLTIPFSSVSQLRELDISHNPIESLGDVQNLINLNTLIASYTQLDNFQELEQFLLQNQVIRKLGLAGLSLDVGLLGSIQRPEALEWLDISDRPYAEFWNIDRFLNLRTLLANRSFVEDTSALGALEYLEVLELNNSGVKGLPFNSSAFNGLKHLDISSNPIVDAYQIQDFIQHYEVNLEVLRLADIPGLEVDVANICYENNIRELNVSGLRLLPGGILDLNACDGIEVLNVSNTDIDSVNFESMHDSLRVLIASNNNLQNGFDFNAIRNVNVLDLSYNSDLDFYNLEQELGMLEQLSSLSLAGISIPMGWSLNVNDEYLTSLDLSNTGIDGLAPLSQLNNLETLIVSNNNLYDVQPLEYLNGIKVLDLSDNPIDYISFDLASRFSGLKFLDVSGTQIQDLYALNALYDLEYLSLAGLALVNPSEAQNLIANNDRLKHLNISGVTGVDLGGLNIENLETLKAADTGLQNLPSNFYFQNLKVLDLSDNNLSNFVSLVDLRGLRSLNLANNNVASLDDLYELYQIEYLNLANNPIVFPLNQSPYFGNDTIRTLILDGVDLSNVNYLDFWGFFLLEELSLANTGLDEFDFFDVPNLRSLNLSSLHLYNIDNLSGLPLLEVLDISDNSEVLDLSVLYQLSNLESLNINRVQIQGNVTIDSLISALPELKELYIEGIQIPDYFSFIQSFPEPQKITALNFSSTLNEPNPDFGLLNDFSALQTLNASSNGFIDLGGLDVDWLNSLLSLDLSNNLLVDIYPLVAGDDTYNNSMIEFIDLSGNDDIPCEQLDQLEQYFVAQHGGTLIRPTACAAGLPPNITLLSPMGGEVFTTDDLVALSAMADDPEDGALNNLIFWESDRDGILGMGPLLDVSLSAGIHLITASVTDSDGNTVNATAQIEVEQTALSYCASSGNYTYYDWIASTTINGVANFSGNNGGYLDATHIQAPLNYGSNSISFTGGTGYYYYRSWERWGVWVDFNQDGQFDYSEKVVTRNGAGSTFSFYVPNTAKPGPTRMRIAMSWFYTPNPCGTYSWGETEDYTVNIQ